MTEGQTGKKKTYREGGGEGWVREEKDLDHPTNILDQMCWQ